MAFQVSGKHIAIGESLAQRARNRVQALVDRHSEGQHSGHMTISREGPGFRADCVLNLNSGVHVNADATSNDAYECVDLAVERLGKQLSKQAAKGKDHAGPAAPDDAGEAALLAKAGRA
jgi:ribosomal subunit interface protein